MSVICARLALHATPREVTRVGLESLQTSCECREEVGRGTELLFSLSLLVSALRQMNVNFGLWQRITPTANIITPILKSFYLQLVFQLLKKQKEQQQ